MKNKIKIFFLILIISIFHVTYAGSFDTTNFNGGTNYGQGGALSTNWGIYGNTGTRYIIELNDVEVGGSNSYKYYVNYIQNNKKTYSRLWMGSMFHGGYLNSDNYWVGATVDTNRFFFC